MRRFIEKIAPKRGAVRSSILLSAANVFLYAMQVVTGLIVAKMLSPQDYGTRALVFSITNVFRMAAGLGLGYAALKFGSEKGAKPKDCVTTSIIGYLASGLVLAIGFAALAYPLSGVYNEPRMALYIIIVAASMLLQFPQAISTLWLIEGRIKRYAIGLSVQGLLFPIIMIPMTRFWGLDGAMFGFLVYTVLASWTYILPKPELGEFRWELFKKMLGFGILSSVSGFLVYTLRNYDTLILGIYASKESVAHYALAYTMLISLTLVPTAVTSIIFPRMSNLFSAARGSNELRRIFRKTLKYTLAYGILAGAGLLVLMHVLLNFFLTKYLPVEKYLPFIIVPLLLDACLETICNSVLASGNMLGRVLRIQAIQLVAGVVACVLLIPSMGLWGAVAALWINHAIGSTLYLLGVKKILFDLRTQTEI